MNIKFCLVFPQIFLLHKVVRDAKKVEKHCSRALTSQPMLFRGEKRNLKVGVSILRLHCILSPFSELLSFVTNSPVAEKALSGSTDVDLFVRRGTVFQGILTSFFSLENTHFLYHNLWSDLFLCWVSVVVFTLKDYLISVL